MKPSEKMYTAEEMDRVIKINMRLLEKFREPLLKEYGASVSDATRKTSRIALRVLYNCNGVCKLIREIFKR